MNQVGKLIGENQAQQGIPPHIDFSQSKNLEQSRILFPAAVLIDEGYASYTGYKKSVILPIELKSNGKNLHLVSDIFTGVCSDICVPFSAKVDLDLAQLQTTAADIEIIETARIGLDIELPSFYPKAFKPEVFLHSPSELPLSQPTLTEIDGTKAVFETKFFKNLSKDDKLSGEMYVLLKLGQRSVETTINLDTLN